MIIDRIRQQVLTQCAAFPASASMRQSAFEQFHVSGLPTIKHEQWKYTSLRELDQFLFLTAEKSLADDCVFPALPFETAGQCVFVNGYFMRAISRLPEGVSVENMSFQSIPSHAFSLMSAAASAESLRIVVVDNISIDKPIDCVFLFTDLAKDCATHMRLNLSIGKQSKVNFISRFVGQTECSYLSNNDMHIDSGESSEVNIYHLQTHSRAAFHIERLSASLSDHAVLNVHSMSLGAKLARMDVDICYQGTQAQSQVCGIYHVDGQQHVDYHLNADHISPHCRSEQHVKGCVDGDARAVFNARVRVPRHSHHSLSEQSHHGLLLSRRARIDAKPELEIDCDDVQCRHGATVGSLNRDALFYLVSRGIEESQAQSILELAHVVSLLEKIKDPQVKDYMQNLIRGRHG